MFSRGDENSSYEESERTESFVSLIGSIAGRLFGLNRDEDSDDLPRLWQSSSGDDEN